VSEPISPPLFASHVALLRVAEVYVRSTLVELWSLKRSCRLLLLPVHLTFIQETATWAAFMLHHCRTVPYADLLADLFTFVSLCSAFFANL
jgi:hypothetical protein